jgi:hypothetical protein
LISRWWDHAPEEEMWMRSSVFAMAVALALGIAPVLLPSADAAIVICQRGKKLTLRDGECRPRETQRGPVDVGAVGPTGATGSAGPTGAPGTDGMDGATGVGGPAVQRVRPAQREQPA